MKSGMLPDYYPEKSK